MSSCPSFDVLFPDSSSPVSLRKKNIWVVGLGKTGWSVVRFLHPWFSSIRVIDNRSSPPFYAQLSKNFPEIPISCGSFPSSCQDVDCVCLSPGVSRREPFLQDLISQGVPVIGDIELFSCLFPHQRSKIVAVTGSNGKSTTTMLVKHFLCFLGYSCEVIGNIGFSVLDFYCDRKEKGLSWPDFLVIELSSFQLESTNSLIPHVCTILNLSHDHIDIHGDFLTYQRAKQRICRHVSCCVVNKDDFVPLLSKTVRVLSFSRFSSEADFFLEGEYVCFRHQRIGQITDFSIQGYAAQANLLAALSLCYALVGEQCFQTRSSWAAFVPLRHRFEYVRTYRGVSFYNDSKATNISSTLSSVKSFCDNVILLLGGVAKGQDFLLLRKELVPRVRAVVVFGQDAACIAHALLGSVPVMIVACLSQAVSLALQCAHSGDVVLLAPACASFDQFKNYQERGDMFCHHVQALGQTDRNE